MGAQVSRGLESLGMTYRETREALGAISRGAILALGRKQGPCHWRAMPLQLGQPRSRQPGRQFLQPVPAALSALDRGQKGPAALPPNRLGPAPQASVATHPLAHQPWVSRGSSRSWGSSGTLRRGRGQLCHSGCSIRGTIPLGLGYLEVGSGWDHVGPAPGRQGLGVGAMK